MEDYLRGPRPFVRGYHSVIRDACNIDLVPTRAPPLTPAEQIAARSENPTYQCLETRVGQESAACIRSPIRRAVDYIAGLFGYK